MLTLVVPTRNRVHFLSRFLNYYADRGFSHPILIADASDPEPYETLERIIWRHRHRLQVTHLLYPGEDAGVCLAHGFKQVRTPYALFAADDDFYVPAALDRCVSFLERSPDYRVAHGICIKFKIDTGRAHGQFLWASHYDYFDIEDESGCARLGHFLGRRYASGNSVHRTEDIRDAYEWAVELKLDVFFLEFLTSCIPVIRGKVKRMEKLFRLWQVHPAQSSVRVPLDPFSWVGTKYWADHYNRFKRCLAEELARQDGVPVWEGEEVVKKYTWLFLSNMFNHDWNIAYAPHRLNGFRAGLKDSFRRALGRLKAGNRLFSFIPTSSMDLSLEDLLHPSSVYHEDFMPIYQAVSRSVEEPVA